MGIFTGLTLKGILGYATVLQTDFHRTKIHFPSQSSSAVSISFKHTESSTGKVLAG